MCMYTCISMCTSRLRASSCTRRDTLRDTLTASICCSSSACRPRAALVAVTSCPTHTTSVQTPAALKRADTFTLRSTRVRVGTLGAPVRAGTLGVLQQAL